MKIPQKFNAGKNDYYIDFDSGCYVRANSEQTAKNKLKRFLDAFEIDIYTIEKQKEEKE